MKSKLSLLIIFISLFSSQQEIKAQDFWRNIDKNKVDIEEQEIYRKQNIPSKFSLVSLAVNDFKGFLKTKSNKVEKIIRLPNGKGGFSKFIIKESSNFDTKLADKFPMIKSYAAKGVDDPTAVAKISIGTDGFHAIIFSKKEKTIYIDPYSKDNKTLIAYKRSNLDLNKDNFTCHVEDFSRRNIAQANLRENTNDGKLRTFRLALACSGEYAQFHLTHQNISVSATDEAKKAAVLSAMNTTMTRVNSVFERDLAVRMVIVENNDEVIFLDSSTDGITDGDPDQMINEVQTICDTKIGNLNYDIGHVFSIGGDGYAGGGVVCIAGQKAKGVTGRNQPVGDPYDIDFVAHEMGHQFGANHTQNNDCNRYSSTAVEPGSGSTIMGYAGICSPNVQNNSSDYFHAVNITEMLNTIQSSATCASLIDTNNTVPNANAGSDFSIPKSTPFVLKGVATDVDGTASLTYNWDQIDNEIAIMPPLSTNSAGPMFRSIPPQSSPNRYFPELETVVAGATSTTWEVLPSVARDLNFSFLVRDNHVGGGSVARDNMTVTVTEANAFTVSNPNTHVSWDVGSTQTITWTKGASDVAPINCQNVNIKLSIDGGLTFPITIKSNTPNDGTEDIVIPNNPSTAARILVEAADNIFYNVNATNFTINSTVPTFLMTSVNEIQSACNSGNESVSYTLSFDFVNGFSEDISFTTTGEPSGSVVVFTPATINEDGDVVVSISNLDNITPQLYTINIVGNSDSVQQNVDIQLNVTKSSFESLMLTSPENNIAEVDINTDLLWSEDTNASSYEVQVAKDSGFSRIVFNENVVTNSYSISSLSGNTIYYWRVKPKNSCGEGDFSEVFNFKTLTPSYCASTFTDEAGGTEHITNVTFNTINNNSGNDTVDGYEDFTSMETTVRRDDSHQISVTFDTGGYQDHCYVFIDWNQDFIFDKTTERYDLGSIEDDIGTATFTINVPNDAKFGRTTMRVIVEYDDPDDNYGEGPCDSDHYTEWGETEDYTIIVGVNANNYIIQTISETCVNQNDGKINVIVNQLGLSYEVSITGPSTNVTQILSDENYSLTDLEPGNYEVCVFAEELNETQCFEVKVEGSEQIFLKVAEQKETKTYSFNISSGTAPYKVFLNEKLVFISEENVFDVVLEENGKLEVKTVKDCEGSFKTSIGNIYLMQNPVTDFVELVLPLTIEENFVKAMVFDMNGKLIFRRLIEKENNSLLISFKSLAKGVYILKLSLQDSKPIKIIKQ